MTRLIVCASGKGGVGKTSLVSNLATALSDLGQDVVAVDANLTTPNLGLHLGMPLASNTLHDVLKGETRIRDATYPHPLGFNIIPASMNVNDLKNVDVGRLPEVTLNLIGKPDYVILDCAAGLGREAISAVEAANEVLIITNPDLPSVADALKMAKIAESQGKQVLGTVVNRVKGKWHELTRKEIEEITPVVNYDPNSPASIEIRKLAHMFVGLPFNVKKPRSFRLLERLIGWLTR